MTTWIWLQFDETTMPHTVPVYLASAVVKEMTARGSVVVSREVCSRCYLDVGGIARVDRPYERFQLYGLSLHVPSEDVALYADELELSAFRTVAGRRYTKIKAFPFRALVLTERHWRALLRKLKARVQSAERRSAVFYADKKPASQLLREANGIAPDDPIDLGGHKNDRFHPVVGEA